MRDLTLIQSDFNIGVDKKELIKLYREATKDSNDFFHVRIEGPAETKFARNWTDYLDYTLECDK
jgi:hypothetical protein